jgi:transposase
MQANGNLAQETGKIQQELKQEKSRSLQLEKELRRKESALAETAALLVLRKKIHAIWGDGEDA